MIMVEVAAEVMWSFSLLHGGVNGDDNTNELTYNRRNSLTVVVW